MQGKPVGAAMEYFNQRYAEIAAQLSSELEDVKFGKAIDDTYLAQLWTATNDARNMLIVGDPGVRLQVPTRPERRQDRGSLPCAAPLGSFPGARHRRAE